MVESLHFIRRHLGAGNALVEGLLETTRKVERWVGLYTQE